MLQIGLPLFENHKRENFLTGYVICGKYNPPGTVELSNYLPTAGARKLSSLHTLNDITYEYITT